MMNIQYDIYLEDVRKRLRTWGHWCNAILAMEVGFSGQSLISHLVNFKGFIVSSTADSIVPENEEAEEVDELVNQFAKISPEKAKILWIHYTTFIRVTERIKKSELGKTTYFKYLAEAEKWVNQHLV